jgi:zinc/manganese transport system substrate-binding protein
VAVTVLALLAGACAANGPTTAAPGSTADTAPPGPPRIVVSTSILGDVVRGAVGNEATVETIAPPAVDPRTYVPTPAQREALARADLVVVNGLGAGPDLAGALRGGCGTPSSSSPLGSRHDRWRGPCRTPLDRVWLDPTA